MAGSPANPPRLIADIGGTNARFALVEAAAGGRGEPAAVRVLSCDEHAGPAEAAAAYLDDVAPPVRPTAAAIAIASPVDGDHVAMTNHAWAFSIDETRRRLGLESLKVVNDFTAMALSAPMLGPDDTRRIGGGAAAEGAPIAVIGPGTGLGVSGLVPNGADWIALATEGGHASLPAADAREAQVIAVLAAEFGHVSLERAISGAGLVNLARAIATVDGVAVGDWTPARLTAAAASDPIAAEALAMFAAMLGTAASNLALSLGARGGVYIGGGIVPRLGAAFPEAAFRARFEDKGRFRPYVAAIPTKVIIRPEPALLGLAGLVQRTA